MDSRYYKFKIFSSYSELDCRFYGKDQAEFVNSEYRSKIIKMEQVHGNRVVFVDKNFSKEVVVGVDGIVSNKKDVYFSVRVADCVPVFLYDFKSKIIGVAHSGWKGTLSDIVGKTVNFMVKKGGEAKNIKCAIGPAICEKHYIVSEERFLIFQKKYPEVVQRKNHLDLKHIVRHKLIDSGVDTKNIQVSSYCTKCSKDKFYSHRGGDGDARNVGIIGIK